MAYQDQTLHRAAIHWLPLALCSTLLALVTGAFAAYGARTREPLTLADARRLVAAMPISRDFPLTVNSAVVARLNRNVTDPGRARDLKTALVRMHKLQPMVSTFLQKYRLPSELMAVPLVESQYENLSQSEWEERLPSTSQFAAGLWMFIPATARTYGLTVNNKVDQRLDPRGETDAAMRLLAQSRTQFKDWWLALAAYNQGTGAVQDAIARGASRHPWTLHEKGLLNDYIVHVTAAVILMHNPQLVE